MTSIASCIRRVAVEKDGYQLFDDIEKMSKEIHESIIKIREWYGTAEVATTKKKLALLLEKADSLKGDLQSLFDSLK